MIPENETRPYRALWATVALHAVKWHRQQIATARRTGKADWIESEIAAARRYIESVDFREACSMAGLTVRPDQVMGAICADDGETWRGVESVGKAGAECHGQGARDPRQLRPAVP